MGFFRKRLDPAEASPVAPVDAPLDLGRFERLIQTSLRLERAGIEHAAIERRAARDAITFNEALEALDRENPSA